MSMQINTIKECLKGVLGDKWGLYMDSSPLERTNRIGLHLVINVGQNITINELLNEVMDQFESTLLFKNMKSDYEYKLAKKDAEIAELKKFKDFYDMQLALKREET